MAVEVISKIKPWAGGDFPIVEAEDVQVTPNERLDKAIKRIDNKLIVITKDEYERGDYDAPEGAIVVVIELVKFMEDDAEGEAVT